MGPHSRIEHLHPAKYPNIAENTKVSIGDRYRGVTEAGDETRHVNTSDRERGYNRAT